MKMVKNEVKHQVRDEVRYLRNELTYSLRINSGGFLFSKIGKDSSKE